MVERAPGQHLEGISVSALPDMAERTAQVITNDHTLHNINGTTMKPGNIKIRLHYVHVPYVWKMSLFASISTLTIERVCFLFLIFFVSR